MVAPLWDCLSSYSELTKKKKPVRREIPMRKEKSMLHTILQKRVIGIALALSAVLVVLTVTVVLAADAYPSKVIRLVSPFAPGGGNEITGRLMSARLTERLGKPVIVDNRGGAGGAIGTDIVAKSAPDGYTLLLIAASQVTTPAIQKLPYDLLKDFAPIAKVGSGPYVFVIHPSVPAKSVKEFIELAKQKPGQLVFASSGIAGINHMGAELLKQAANIDCIVAHYKGGGPAWIAVLGGHCNAQLGSVITSLPYIKTGQLKALATCGVKRTPMLPEVPTFIELGFPNFEISGFWAILAPAGTPAPIVDRLTKEIKEILLTDSAKKVIEDQGSVVDYQGPAALGKFLENQITMWKSVAKTANIKLELEK
jgi:tripartite-type tricarboxylate transporter receptor subunit TctC